LFVDAAGLEVDVGCSLFLQVYEKRKTTQAVTATPLFDSATLIKEQEPLWYRLP